MRLQYYYSGSNGYGKITSPVLLAKIFGNSRRIMSREIKRGLVIYSKSTPMFDVERYNAEQAQLDAETKMTANGPMPKSGKQHALVGRISNLIL